MTTLAIRNANIWTGDPRRRALTPRSSRTASSPSLAARPTPTSHPSPKRSTPRGRLVLPGFTDSHTHLLGTGLAMQSVDLKAVPSVEEAARRVAERIQTAAAGAWISVPAGIRTTGPVPRFPDRRSLDAVAPEQPVVLTHTSGHCTWVNTAALRAAGITARNACPEGGAIDVDVAGEPTGILRDNASRLITDVAPKLHQDDRIAALKQAIAHAHSLGVTGVHAMDVSRGEFQALHALNDAGDLRLRVRPFMSHRMLDEWIERNLATGDGDDMLRIGGVKFFADGALGSMTAWMLEPCEGATDTGLALQPAADLERDVRRCLEARSRARDPRDRRPREPRGARHHRTAPAISRRISRAASSMRSCSRRSISRASRTKASPPPSSRSTRRRTWRRSIAPGARAARRVRIRVAATARRQPRVRLGHARRDHGPHRRHPRRRHAPQRRRRAGRRLVPRPAPARRCGDRRVHVRPGARRPRRRRSGRIAPGCRADFVVLSETSSPCPTRCASSTRAWKRRSSRAKSCTADRHLHERPYGTCAPACASSNLRVHEQDMDRRHLVACARPRPALACDGRTRIATKTPRNHRRPQRSRRRPQPIPVAVPKSQLRFAGYPSAIAPVPHCRSGRRRRELPRRACSPRGRCR